MLSITNHFSGGKITTVIVKSIEFHIFQDKEDILNVIHILFNILFNKTH